MFFKAGTLLFCIIFLRELAVHWQLANSGHPDLVECHSNLNQALKDISALQNKSNSMISKIREAELLSLERPRIASETALIKQDSALPAVDQGHHLLSTVEIFRRFVLQPPAPAKVPYNLKNEVATHYSQSEQDKKIDNLLKQREKGFFIEVQAPLLARRSSREPRCDDHLQVGAYDGEIMSNSLFFEKSRGSARLKFRDRDQFGERASESESESE